MSKDLQKQRPRGLFDFLSGFGSKAPILAEKARLEAFLAAFPGEYCGWAHDGSVAYSQGFLDILGLERLKTISDIQSCLAPSDAAALESMCERLRRSGTPFSLQVQNYAETRTLNISGNSGRDLSGRDRFDVLWVEDITDQIKAQKEYQAQNEIYHRRVEELREALASLPNPCWLRNKDQEIIWVNRAYYTALKTTQEEVLRQQKEIAPAKRLQKTTVGSGLQPGPEQAAAALRENKVQEVQTHLIIGGQRRLMQILEIPLKEYELTLGRSEDITRQEDLEKELQRYQKSNRELLEHLHSAIAMYNDDHRLEFYNSAFAQLWHLEDQYLNTRPKLGDIMEKLRETRRLPEQADFRSFKQTWLNMFTSLIDPYEEMLYLPDGSALRMLAIPHSMGGLMMTFEDVTSRLELESSYNTLIAVQRETLDNLAEGVAVYGGDGRLKLCNPAFSRLWNLDPEVLEGEPHISSVVEKMKGFFTEAEWKTRREELISKGLDRMMYEGRYHRADGTLIDYATVPLPDGGVLVTYSDVTDSVRVENALREKNTALETAERLKLDFLANVSYQLRTPLNAIMGFTEILEQEYFGPLNNRQKEYTQDMQKASAKLLGLIDDILDLSTIEAGYLNMQSEPVKLYDLMHNIAELVQEWARKENLKFTLVCAKNIGSLEADKTRLKQALINLVRNAIAFTPAGGDIKLSAKKQDTGISFAVSDTGVGIPQEDQTRIFDAFERAQSVGQQKSPMAAKSGAGLGLSLVKNIAKLHSGTVTLESQEGKGTTVSLFIPFEKTPAKKNKIPKSIAAALSS